MTFLPIVERELRIAARLTATYRNRAILVAVIAAVAMIMLVFGAFAATPSQVGQSMFWTLGVMGLIFCLFEGVRKTADCLSEERREGTLGLLFLTDLKGYDIILGKLAATSLNSFYGLLSILPVLALPMLLGGVTPGEFWRIALALISNLFFSLATGLWISARSRREQQAMGAAFAVILVIVVIPMCVPRHYLSAISPARAFFGASARGYSLAPQLYWRSLQYTQAMSWAMLLWAALVVPRAWRDENVVVKKSGWFARATSPLATVAGRRTEQQDLEKSSLRAAKGADLRARMLDINPSFWLAMRGTRRPYVLRVAFILVFISSAVFTFNTNLNALPALLGFFWLLNLVLKMRVAAQSCRCLAEARRNNALEMLLVTPLTVDQIINGQLLALRRMFLVPLITILAFEIGGVVCGVEASAWTKAVPQFSDDLIFAVGLTWGIFGYVILFVLDIFAGVWAGMWFGLSSKKESQAVTKTIFFTLVLPMFCAILFCYGLPFVIGIPIFWIAWAGQKVRREFRQLAAQRYISKLPDAGWLPGVGGQVSTSI